MTAAKHILILCACSWRGPLATHADCPSCGRGRGHRVSDKHLAVLRALVVGEQPKIEPMMRIWLFERQLIAPRGPGARAAAWPAARAVPEAAVPDHGARPPGRRRRGRRGEERGMRALTVIQPWASLIVGSPTVPPQKPIENRSWPPPASMIGEQFAIHAGKKLDLDEFEDVFLDKVCGEVRPPFATPQLFPLGAVVGVATLDRAIALQQGRDQMSIFEDRFKYIAPATVASWRLDDDALRWFFGRVGFVLRDRRHLATPIPCKGALGFWRLSSDVERAVVAQIRATS